MYQQILGVVEYKNKIKQNYDPRISTSVTLVIRIHAYLLFFKYTSNRIHKRKVDLSLSNLYFLISKVFINNIL